MGVVGVHWLVMATTTVAVVLMVVPMSPPVVPRSAVSVMSWVAMWWGWAPPPFQHRHPRRLGNQQRSDQPLAQPVASRGNVAEQLIRPLRRHVTGPSNQPGQGTMSRWLLKLASAVNPGWDRSVAYNGSGGSCQATSVSGEHLIEPLTKTSRGVGMRLVEFSREEFRFA